MSEQWDDWYELREREAIDWFRGTQPLGPKALDYAITAMNEQFGPAVEVAAIAPIEPIRQSPIGLFFAVDDDIASELVWRRLVEAHRFVADAARARSSSELDQAASRLHLVIARVPGSRPLGIAMQDWFGMR